MATELDKKTNKLAELLETMKPEIQKTLPKWITPDRMLRVVLTELRTTPKLAQCESKSVLSSVMQCAQLGLEPGGVLGHAFLIPYKTTCQVIIGYKGLIDLARRSGEIVSISARVVHEKDAFAYSYGLEDKLEHTPVDGDRGQPTYIYAVAQLRGGGHAYEVMTVEDVNKIRDVVLKKMHKPNESPWSQHWGEMARKTAIRRLFKYLPVSIIPRQAHDILHDEDERFAVDTTAQVIEDSVLTPGRHKVGRSENKQEEPTTEQQADEKSTLFEVSAAMAHEVEQAAVASGWEMAQMHTWVGRTYGCELRHVLTQIAYDEILLHMKTETPDGKAVEA